MKNPRVNSTDLKSIFSCPLEECMSTVNNDKITCNLVRHQYFSRRLPCHFANNCVIKV